eukprot:scaffold79118_cov35-Attheya_sp.AAC.3
MQETLEEIKHTEGQSLDISSLLSAGFFFPSRRLTFDGMSRMGSPSIRLVQAVPTLAHWNWIGVFSLSLLNFHAASETTPRFLAESIQSNRALRGPTDAAGSCGSNPGRIIAIRGLLPDLSLLFVPSLSSQFGYYLAYSNGCGSFPWY